MKRFHRLLAGLPFCLPAFAQAQLLDFDSVCAAPPCAIGSLYAPSGITFAPNSADRRGRDQRFDRHRGRGPLPVDRELPLPDHDHAGSAGDVLRHAALPRQHILRPGDGRRNLAQGGRAGSNQNVVLTNVNAWSLASASVPGGFDSIFLDPSGGANLTFGIDGIQFGGTCNGFSDVQPADSFCNASEWLANRGVTLGCAAGQYCPAQNVTRAAMALFMQRLGDALTPQYAQTTEASRATSIRPGICVRRRRSWSAEVRARRSCMALVSSSMHRPRWACSSKPPTRPTTVRPGLEIPGFGFGDPRE